MTENLPPEAVRRLAKDIQDWQSDVPEGIRLFPNEKNIAEIEAVLTGPGLCYACTSVVDLLSIAGTPYEGGEFRLKLIFGAEFPQCPPKGYFLTKIFHPNVAKSGEICVNTLKKDWKKEMGIRHILLTIKCLLIDPNPESALNEEAGRLLLERYEDYAAHAKLMTSIHAASKAVDSSTAEGGAENQAPFKDEAKKTRLDGIVITEKARVPCKVKRTLRRL